MTSKNQASTQHKPLESNDLLASIEADPLASIMAVRAAMLTLTAIGLDYAGRRPAHSDEAWTRHRVAMASPYCIRMYVQSARWIAQAERLPFLNRQRTSYDLKSEAEVWRDNSYIFHGMFLAACCAMGVRIEPIPGTPNAAVNLA